MKKLIRRVCLKTSFKGEWVNHVSQEALVKFFVNFLVAPTHCVHLKKVNFEAMHPKPYRSGGVCLRNNYIWPPCFWKFTWCCTKTWLWTRKDQLVFSNRSPWFLLMMTRRKNVQRWQTEWYWEKKIKVIVGKIVQKIDLEKHDLLHFPFFLEQSGRREPMWMESKIKSFGWFCKRHLFKFCIFSTSEGGCLCLGAKYTAACQVLEDVKTRIAFAHWVSNKVQIENHFLSLKVWNCVWQAAFI